GGPARVPGAVPSGAPDTGRPRRARDGAPPKRMVRHHLRLPGGWGDDRRRDRPRRRHLRWLSHRVTTEPTRDEPVPRLIELGPHAVPAYGAPGPTRIRSPGARRAWRPAWQGQRPPPPRTHPRRSRR